MDLEPQQEMNIAQRIVQQLHYIIKESEFIFTEFISGVVVALWGLWIANPYISTFSTSATFEGIRALPIDETIIGCFIAFIGCVQLFGMLTDIFAIRKYGIAAIVIIWICLSTTFIISNPLSPATIAYPPYACIAFWAFCRLIVQKATGNV